MRQSRRRHHRRRSSVDVKAITVPRGGPKITEEAQASGDITLKSYLEYFLVGASVAHLVAAFLVFVASIIANTVSSIILRQW